MTSRRALTLTAMSLGYAVVQLDVTIVNTALDSIDRSLGGGIAALQWIVSAYTVTFAAFILTAGALGDRLGARRVFAGGFALFTAASLVCALAPSMAILLAGRVLQGVGAAILVPNSLALLNHAYSDDAGRGRAVAVWAAGASAALTAGPLAGGALITLIGWRSIFLVNVPIGLIGLWLTWRFADDTSPTPGRELDLAGQGLAMAALALLTAATIEGGSLGFRNPRVAAGLAGTAVAAVLFVWRERCARQPMLPLTLFRERLFTLMTLDGLLVNVAFYGLIFVLSLYFQQVNHLSAWLTGLAFMPMLAAILPANLLAPRIAARIGALLTIGIGGCLGAIACVALLVLAAGTAYRALFIQLIALGAGLGLLVPPMTSTLLGCIDKRRSGVAAAVLNSARQTGSALGVALFGSLVAGNFVLGAHRALAVCAALLLTTAFITSLTGWRTSAVSSAPGRRG
jgi:DHA2 family methylenomycin A resistance protein-like MFS transporter